MQIKHYLKDEYSNKFFKLILDNPDKNWDWYAIGKNPNITMKIILDNPDKNWNWDAISENPNVLMKDILNNPDKKWGWISISNNPFKCDKNNYIKSNNKKILLTFLLKK